MRFVECGVVSAFAEALRLVLGRVPLVSIGVGGLPLRECDKISAIAYTHCFFHMFLRKSCHLISLPFCLDSLLETIRQLCTSHVASHFIHKTAHL